MKSYSALLFFALSQPVFAESEFLMPGEAWGFRFNTPKLANQQSKESNHDFRFEAWTKSGFVVSGFVESADGKGRNAQECREFYWALASKNSNIQKDTIAVIQSEPFAVVSYLIDITYQGKRYIQPNANYYGYRDGKCIDFHVSQIFPYEAEIDYSNMLEFGRTFGYYQ